MLHFGFVEIVTKRRHCFSSLDEMSSLVWPIDLTPRHRRVNRHAFRSKPSGGTCGAPTLMNCFGFGDTNAAFAFGRFKD